jgi:hypothetical protein
MNRPDRGLIRYRASEKRGTHVYAWIEVTPGEWRWRRFGRTCYKGRGHFVGVTAQGTIGSGHRTRTDAENWLFSVEEYGIYNGELPAPGLSVAGATVQA